ncbi:MAG: hypothetical protein Q9215_005469 [Flavoplaca cf. flavocitrina]
MNIWCPTVLCRIQIQDLQIWWLETLAHAFLVDVQRKSTTKSLADGAILTQLNALSNRSDGVWWESIVQHRLQTKAESEGEKVNRQFGHANKMNQETAKRMAELINTEQIDLITFEAIAGAPNDRGKRPTFQAIQRRRWACQEEAREKLKMELAHADIDSSQTLAHPAPTERTEIARSSPQHQLIESMQPEATRTAGLHLSRSFGIEQPVNHNVDPRIDTRSPTPIDTTHPADIIDVISSPIAVTERGTEIETSLCSTENMVEELEHQPDPDLSTSFVDSSHSAGAFSISSNDPYSDFSNAPHCQAQQPVSSAPVPQASDSIIPDSSSPTTPQPASSASFTPAPVRPPVEHAGSWQNIKWAYLTHTQADIELQSKGVWLFEKPQTATTEKDVNDISSLQLQSGCPIVISSDFEDRNEPYLEYNDNALTTYTHLPAWTNDSRSVENFAGIVPDFQSDVPLAEYQTIEALGSYVWRHNRDLLPCSAPDCKKMLSDMTVSTIICLGCGPKSVVRFCSVNCHLASLSKHVTECWDPRLLINKLIDENTAPPRFSHLAPSLRDRYGYRTYQNYRQRVAAQYSGGRYSMFNPATEEATILVWDRKFTRSRHHELPFDGYATGMESRIERCLNIALFDHTNTAVLEHLYRLLQLCLHVKGAWKPALAVVLSRQFALEFNYDANTSLRVRANEPFCECEWEGGAVQLHESMCSSRYRGHGEVFQGQRSVRDVVGMMENKHWILRAWRRQHRTEHAWNRRATGIGFPGVTIEEGWMPRLGKGWVGFNGEDDDVAS